jgi:pimeloyl-ACP methyl ester carboxylesterase
VNEQPGGEELKRARVDDAELEYEISGDAVPMLFIHGANLADGLAAVAGSSALSELATVIRYHRRGMGGSTGPSGPTTVERQALDALGLLNALEIERAHVVGYSYGGTIALELAAQAPDRLLSLSLLEPIIVTVPSAEAFMASMAPINARYAAGDAAGAVTGTFAALGGPSWRELVEAAAGPGSVERAIEDAATFFESEAPSLATWSIDEKGLSAVRCPVLSVCGTSSGRFFAEGRALLHRCLPQCVDADVHDATHFLPIQQPDEVARAIAQFVPVPAVAN